MQNFVAQTMRRFGLAPDNKVNTTSAKPDSDVGGAKDPLAHMKVQGDKWSYTTLEYPLDLQTRSDLGHYMLFYVNVPVNSTYQAGVYGKGDYQVGKEVGQKKKYTKKPTKTANTLDAFV